MKTRDTYTSIELAQKGIQDDLGKNTYNSWAAPLVPESDDGETLILRHHLEFAPRHIMSSEIKVMNALQHHTRRRIKIIGPHEKIEWEEPKKDCSSAA